MTSSPPPSGPPKRSLLTRLQTWAGERGTPRRVLVRNSAWETSVHATQMVVMFFLTPFIVARLGNDLYGIWEIIYSLVGLLGFADLGVRPAVVHFIARHGAQNDDEAVNRFVNTAFSTFSVAGAFVCLAAVPLALFLPSFWNIAAGFEREATVALLIVAGEVGLSLPLQAFSAVLVGKQRYDVLNAIRVGVLVVKSALIILVLSEGLGLVPLAVVVAGSAFLEMVCFSIAAFRIQPSLRFNLRWVNRDAVVSLLKFGGWATAVILGLQVIWTTDALVIGRARDAAAVAFFAIGFGLPRSARDLLRVATRVVEPAAGALYGLGDREGILRLLSGSVRAVLLMAGPILVYLVVVGQPFLLQWMGAEYAEKSSAVLRIMVLAVLPPIASAPLAAILYGTNRVRPLAALVGFEALLNLGLSIALVGPYGIEGVAWGTAIPSWLVHAVLLPVLVCRHVKVRFVAFAHKTWAGPVLASGATYVGLRLAASPDGAYGWPALFALAALSVALYVAAALLLRLVAPALFEGTPLPGLAKRGEAAS